ncbi:O-acetyl-ADP-ribose deacetylase [Hoeflea prorocentri]|uniref:O-acetyl-ADP-ribose deacetylase n=1 Tax=Hoeflea prorocentri TaxID=1922333 RepID=A0A9X3UGT6_9HYPH|nr:O-acetyl-ADP-ribose deacetylase [Hoeflea prorocentri]MCY6380558.1 O-acetyl-ADP-ribose deacetylase [Hoeflea prorocentri]MDA5398358.1 O-acetyl-ADP-ribose deacetylase [Hoeflea prorocentri]
MELTPVRTDITKLKVDAVVNAANPSLMGGGGVDGAIHRAGGPDILAECGAIIDRIGRCEPGQAVITHAGRLPARFVIHTVGPVWRGGGEGEEHVLACCYQASLQLCFENGLRSVAFPNISTGIYGYPKQAAAKTAIETIKAAAVCDQMEAIFLCCFDWENFQIYQELLRVE